MFTIRPYKGVNHVDFGVDEILVRSHFGQPDFREVNRFGVPELHYSRMICRFGNPDRTLTEVTFLQGAKVSIGDIIVTWNPSFLEKLLLVDRDLRLSNGYVISKKFGCMLSGFLDEGDEELAVHAEHDEVWASLKWTPYTGKNHDDVKA